MAANQEIARRIRLFASLQAAHRALAREAHPSALAPLRAEARDLLVRLQQLAASARAEETPQGSPALAAELAAVDRVLEAQTGRTLGLLREVELPHLRALAPTLVRDHPEELKGLVDVILEGELGDDKTLRTLEYLITLLCTEERGGRRQVIRDPAGLTPRLEERTGAWVPTADVVVAERALENAVTRLRQGDELGEIRDRVRRYKQELGADLLHPPVLAAVIAYNAAMWNQIAVELESIRSVEDLAAELFEVTGAASETGGAPSSQSGAELLRSVAFRRIVSAFVARLHGAPLGDDDAARIVERLDLKLFGLEDLEALDTADESESGWLVRSTVVLGCLLRNLPDLGDALSELGLDPDALETTCGEALRESLSELARKRFADSNYGEAFRLSELKRRHLGAVGSGGRSASRPPRAAKPERATEVQLDTRTLPGPALWLSLAAALLLALYLVPSVSDWRATESVVADGALEAVSPFLVSGFVRDAEGGGRRFVGRLGPAWTFLGTSERREVASAIGEHFSGEGVSSVVLMDEAGHLAAQYTDGAIAALTPREPSPR